MSATDEFAVTGASNVAIAMRDGTVLRADVLRPAVDRPVPVILLRNPYPAAVARRQLDQFRAVQAGFAVVAQSVRGTGASDGEFDPWRWEATDGYDTIAWCAQQAWSSGRVGTYGASYLAHVQTYAASSAPPALAAMSLHVVPANPYDLTYRHGVLLLASSLNWSVAQAGGRIMRAMSRGEAITGEFAELRSAMDDFAELTRTAPLRDIALLARRFPEWGDWLDHPTDDEWWHESAVPDRPAIPTLITAGWWDLFLSGSLAEFARQPRHGDTRLVVGPWSHMIDGTGHGDVYYGPASGGPAVDLEGTRLAFLARYLEPTSAIGGSPTDTADAAPVRIFVMGANEWRDEAAWPLERAVDTLLYFHHGGGLSPRPPDTGAPPATYVHDPLHPVPTVGGANLIPGSEGAHNTGPCEQTRLDDRDDILRFRTQPLAAAVEATGEIRVTLHAATSAVDTDWTAKLVDVWPDGRAYNVADGIVRARHRNSSQHTALVPPGEPTRFEIGLGATSHVFLAGHRIRVDVASSNFPRYDRNPGTGACSADVPESVFVSAGQTVFVDAARPSAITLPVVAR